MDDKEFELVTTHLFGMWEARALSMRKTIYLDFPDEDNYYVPEDTCLGESQVIWKREGSRNWDGLIQRRGQNV